MENVEVFKPVTLSKEQFDLVNHFLRTHVTKWSLLIEGLEMKFLDMDEALSRHATYLNEFHDLMDKMFEVE